MRQLLCGVLFVALASTGCQSGAQPAPAEGAIVGWREVATWTGRGNSQLDMFPIDGWTWRIRWETKNAPVAAGTLRVEAHSADSGRILAEPINAKGNAHDTAYVTELPHRYYLVVEAKDVDWSLTVEDPILAP